MKKYLITTNISTKDMLTSASSESLKNYTPYFDATVVARLKEQGYEIDKKIDINELGFVTDNLVTNVGKELIKNNISFAIMSDTYANITHEANINEVFGYKPTYGLIPRFGLVQVASSLDTIGILSEDLEVILKVKTIIEGYDSFDMTSYDYNDKAEDKPVAFIRELVADDAFYQLINKEHIKGISIDESILKVIKGTHKIIASAESVSSMGSFSSITIDPRSEGDSFEEIATNYRSTTLGIDVLKQLVLGSYILDNKNYNKLFLKAKKTRRVIKNEFDKLLKDNILIIPNVNKINNFKDIVLVANLGGYPVLSYKDFTLIGNINDDLLLFNKMKELI